ncbi:MAG: GNAT family N-acetyltransferase [Myxococcota bacterium]
MSVVDRDRVRRVRNSDLRELARLWTALTEYHASLDPAFALAPTARAEVPGLMGHLKHARSEIFVAPAGDGADDAGEALAGMCIVRVDRGHPVHAEKERAEISDLFVEPSARRRGLGGALADAALRWAEERGVPRVEVRVAAGNAAGQAFWRARGFGDFMQVLQRRTPPER